MHSHILEYGPADKKLKTEASNQKQDAGQVDETDRQLPGRSWRSLRVADGKGNLVLYDVAVDGKNTESNFVLARYKRLDSTEIVFGSLVSTSTLSRSTRLPPESITLREEKRASRRSLNHS